MEPTDPMNTEEFRIWGKKMIDMVADYWDGLREREPLHNVKPGYIWDLVPTDPPETPEAWESVLGDVEKVVLSANTHWLHPHFFSYYPTACSYPSIVADILSAGISCIGFTWNSSPSCTELEMVMMDWLARMLHLPEHFLNSDPGFGGGIIQGTASEATYVALLIARSRAQNKHKEQQSIDNATLNLKNVSRTVWTKLYQLMGRDVSGLDDPQPKLVAYTSDQAHSSVEKAGLMGGITMRKLKTDKSDNYTLRAETLENAIREDLSRGMVPFFVCATVGATTCCAIDDLKGLGRVAEKYGAWFHVDAAYAGSAAICEEYRYLLDGIELADSFNYNPHKWMLVGFDCSAMWFRDTREVEGAFLVDPLYLKHAHQKSAVPDYRNWQIPLGRRFRSLKLWFVMRTLGVSGLQANIRKHCALAKQFGAFVENDSRFELFVPVTLGLVCFRLKGENSYTERLLSEINTDRRIHLVPSQIEDTYFLRLAVCSTKTTQEDITFAWNVIEGLADNVVPR